jgi:hypothetical protein
LPTVAKCTANPALLGCDVVLPPTAKNPVLQVLKDISQIKTDPVASNGLVPVANSASADGGVKDPNAAGNKDGGEKDKDSGGKDNDKKEKEKDKDKDKESQEQQSASGDKKDAKPKKNYCN